jgi:putative FmdB family regulatory protein
MPTYEYACTSCGEHLEVVQSFRDDALTECPACGGKLRKVFGSIGVVFKGSGFYKTDSRPSSGSGDKAASSGDKAASSAVNEKSGSTASPSESSGSSSSGATGGGAKSAGDSGSGTSGGSGSSSSGSGSSGSGKAAAAAS